MMWAAAGIWPLILLRQSLDRRRARSGEVVYDLQRARGLALAVEFGRCA